MSKIYFISGHRNITEEEFIQHYEPVLWDKINEPEVSFVVGDCRGVDDRAQRYLKAMGVRDVTVYHMFEEPMHNSGFNLKGGFNSDVERDYNMTLDSDEDICWVRKGSERSGTQQNIDRRKWIKERKEKGLSISLSELNIRECNNFI